MRQFKPRQFRQRQFNQRQFYKFSAVPVHHGGDGAKLHPILLSRRGSQLVEKILDSPSPIPAKVKARPIPHVELATDREGFLRPKVIIEREEQARAKLETATVLRRAREERDFADLLAIEGLDE